MNVKRSSMRIAFLLVLSVVLTALVWSGASLAAPTGLTKTYIISLDKTGPYSSQVDEKAALKLVNQLLEQGAPVQWALEGFQAGGRSYPAGTFFLETPFQTPNGISSEVVVSWLDAQGRRTGVYPIRQTSGAIEVESKALVLPRICLFYDQTTYENCLKHYQLFTSMGFDVTLATAGELLVSVDDPSSVLARSNVFVMPGGAMHLWAFPYDDQAKAVENIQKFVKAGGGYVGVCAGASEALAQTPYTNLGLVDANYHSEWFDYADPAAGDWDWRALIGPVNLKVTDPQIRSCSATAPMPCGLATQPRQCTTGAARPCGMKAVA